MAKMIYDNFALQNIFFLNKGLGFLQAAVLFLSL